MARKKSDLTEESPVAATEDDTAALKAAFDGGYLQCAKDIRVMHGDNPNPTLSLFLRRVIDGESSPDPVENAYPEGSS
jgi:hypothetical protein